MRYLNKTDAINLVLQEIKEYRKGIELLPQIKEVIIKFDGKVLNKRLQTALQLIDNSICVRNETYSLNIYKWISERSIKSVKSDCWEYISINQIDYLTSYDKDCVKGGIINSKLIIEAMERQIKRQLEYYAQAEEQLTQIDEYIQTKKRLEDDITQYNEKVNYLIKDYFDLAINLRH